MKKTSLLILFCLLCAGFSFAQTTKPLALSRAGARHDGAATYDSAVLSNGTTVIVGFKSMVNKSWQYGFIALMKPDGTLIKEILLGEGARGASSLRKVIVEPETDNIYVLGSTNLWEGEFGSRNSPDEDGILVKIDPNGNFIWWHVFGSPSHDTFDQLCFLPNGNIACLGREGFSTANGNAYLRTFNPDGEHLQRTKLPFTGKDRVTQACAAQSGGFWVTTRNIQRNAQNQVMDMAPKLIHLSQGGQIIAETSIRGSKAQTVDDLLETADGQVLVSIKSYSNDGDFDGTGNYIFSFDQSAQMLWKQFFLIPAKEINSMKIAARPSGEIYCAINVSDVVPEFPLRVIGMVNIWIAKLDADGNLLEKKRVDALGHFCECIDIDWHNGEFRMSVDGQAKHSMKTYIPHDAWYCSVAGF